MYELVVIKSLQESVCINVEHTKTKGGDRMKEKDFTNDFAAAKTYAKKHGIFGKLKTFFDLTGKVLNGEIKVPEILIGTIIGALIYIFSPIDLVPDFIPGAGLLDDIAVATAVVNQIIKAISNHSESEE